MRKHEKLSQHSHTLDSPSIEQFINIFQSLSEAVLVQDREYKCVYANDIAAQLCGFENAESFKKASIDDVINKFQIYTEDGAPFPKSDLTARRALSGEDFAEAIYCMKDSRQKIEKMTKATSRPIYDKKGNISYAVTTFRDITQERRSERHAQFLVEASHIFNTSLNFNVTIDSLGKLVVPRLADWYGIELLNEDGVLETIHADHTDKDKVKLAFEMRDKYPSDPSNLDSGTYKVLSTGESELYNGITQEMLQQSAVNEEHSELLKQLDITSALIVPLKIGDRVIGVMNLCNSGADRFFDKADQKLAQELAVRASFAIENSKLYSSLKEKQNRLDLAINAAKLGVFDWELRSQKLYWSDRTIEIFGYNKEEFNGTYEEYVSRIHPDDRKDSELLVKKAIEEKRNYTLEHRLLLPDGTVKWLLGNGHAYYDSNDNPIRISGTVKDITWRKEADLNRDKIVQLQKIAAKLSGNKEPFDVAHTIVTQSADFIKISGSAMVLLEEDGQFRVVYSDGKMGKNRILNETIILEDNEPLFQSFMTLGTVIKPMSSSQSHSANTVVCPLIEQEKCIGFFEFQIERDFISPSVKEYLDALSHHASQSLGRIKSLQDAQLAKVRADQASAAKSRFLANMSHEIRTPMNAILGFSELLSDSGLSDSDRQNYIKRIELNGEYLVHLIDDILDLSRVEAGEMHIEQDSFSIREVLNDIFESLRVLVVEKDIEPKLEISSEVPDLIVTDYIRLKQVLMNLLSNSAKFTKSGFIEIRVFCDAKEGVICFEVEDNGIGMSKDVQNSIFKPFAQGDNSITRQFGGTGLGLVLSRKICEILDGSLELVESEKNKGSLFRVTLPLKEGAEKDLKEWTSLEGQIIKYLPLRVLLVEDSIDNQSLFKIYLEKFVNELDIANNGEEALQKCAENPYDFILMDIQMPVMDGLKATEELRGQGFVGPIVALTAHALPEEVERSLNAGCSSHLIKPISAKNLRAEIIRLVNANGNG